MSQQREIFSKLKAVQSAKSLPAYDSPVSRSLDNMDMTDFLFELIKQTKGQEGLKNIAIKSSLGELDGNMNINMTVFNILREVFFCLFDIIIPENLTIDNDGFFVNIVEIDPNRMLATDPNSPEGRFLYDGNDPLKHLNYLIYTAQNASVPVYYKKNGKTLLSIEYVGSSQFKIHIGKEYGNKKLSEWAEDYLQDMSFFNVSNFISQLVNIITGVISIKTNKSSEAFQQDAKLSAAMGKLFGFCQDDGSGSNSDNDNAGQDLVPIDVSSHNFMRNRENRDVRNTRTMPQDLFSFTAPELLNIEDMANLRQQGKIRFSTCGNYEMTVDPDEMFNKMAALFADQYTGKNVVDEFGNETNIPAYDNETAVTDVNDIAAFLGNIVPDNALKSEPNASDGGGPSVGNEFGTSSAFGVSANLPNIEAEFELGIIKAIPFAITQMIISPQLLLLIKTAAVVIGEEENTQTFTIESVIEKLWSIIEKIGNDIWNALLNNLFGILTKELTQILQGLATKYLGQQAQNYLSVIMFLVNLIKGLKLEANGCQSMLDTISRLLSLNYFGPQLPVPPPLVYVGGMLKPGMNQVSAVNDLKSALANKGIEVGATMSDGTPNYLMTSMEILTDILIKEVQKASVPVMVNGLTGPAMGYAQIV